jgi:hypothetical protein
MAAMGGVLILACCLSAFGYYVCPVQTPQPSRQALASNANRTEAERPPKKATHAAVADQQKAEVQLYERFIVEKTRRIKLYQRGFTLQVEMLGHMANRQMLKPGINVDLEEVTKASVHAYDQWLDDRDRADIDFAQLIVEIQTHFKNSDQLTVLIKAVLKEIRLAVDEPNQEDCRSMETIQQYLDKLNQTNVYPRMSSDVRKPLDDLADYLRASLKL